MWNRPGLTVGLLASGLLTSCVEGEVACTAIGCINQLEVSIHPASGTLRSGAYSVTVKSSDFEKTYSCGVGTSTEPCPTMESPFNDGIVFVRNSLLLKIHQVPRSVTITTSRNGKQIDETTLTPAYEPLFPNGVECGAACEQGKAEVVLE